MQNVAKSKKWLFILNDIIKTANITQQLKYRKHVIRVYVSMPIGDGVWNSFVFHVLNLCAVEFSFPFVFKIDKITQIPLCRHHGNKNPRLTVNIYRFPYQR